MRHSYSPCSCLHQREAVRRVPAVTGLYWGTSRRANPCSSRPVNSDHSQVKTRADPAATLCAPQGSIGRHFHLPVFILTGIWMEDSWSLMGSACRLQPFITREACNEIGRLDTRPSVSILFLGGADDNELFRDVIYAHMNSTVVKHSHYSNGTEALVLQPCGREKGGGEGWKTLWVHMPSLNNSGKPLEASSLAYAWRLLQSDLSGMTPYPNYIVLSNDEYSKSLAIHNSSEGLLKKTADSLRQWISTAKTDVARIQVGLNEVGGMTTLNDYASDPPSPNMPTLYRLLSRTPNWRGTHPSL